MIRDFDSAIMDNVMDMKEQIGSLVAIVKRHDEVTFPEIQETLTRIDSKHNQDYLQYVEAKEALEKRISPLEEHVAAHKLQSAESRKFRYGMADRIIMTLIGIGSSVITYYLTNK